MLLPDISPMKKKRFPPAPEKEKLMFRLRKIKCQIEGMEKMVQSNATTAEVLNRAISARRALKLFVNKELQSRIRLCVKSAAKTSERRRELRRFQAILIRYIA